ncbi:hypothetical protein CH371_17880 [Leptospira wolffii]|uniref:Colicin D immunity protein domain-containing protein n=1 Tax=Leptospira wolffii TaxID=409998 RepID=A0A2M9Z8F1_9LEPT|nr:colicin immunity domain-containing protein [Leptospira wolffii]PJZ64637.1 hypothetical protein CH371_17880 [Leptospira wolffii]
MLKYVLAKYILLISDFLEEQITAKEFETYYLQMVKGEPFLLDDNVYQIIQTLFWAVDEYVPDYLYDPNDPDNINETQLRNSAQEALLQLQKVDKN